MIDVVTVIADNLLSQMISHLATELKGRVPKAPKPDATGTRKLTPDQERMLREAITLVAREVFASVGLGGAINAIIDAAVERVERDPSILLPENAATLTAQEEPDTLQATGQLGAALKASKRPFKLSKKTRNAIGAILIQIVGATPPTVGGAYLATHLAQQAQQQVTVSVQVTGDDVNVRPLPSTDNDPITTLQNGTYLTKIEDADEWVHIRIDDPQHPHHGLVGYVNKKYLREAL